MSDYSPTSTPDLSTLAEREREEVRRRTAIGVAIAAAMLALLASFIAVDPHKIGSVLLAGGILAGVSLISWMRHCGSGHDHERLRQQNIQILALLRKLHKSAEAARIEHREALEAARIEYSQALQSIGEQFDESLLDLAARIDANERDRRIADAERIAKRIDQHLSEEDPGAPPKMGRTVLHSVAAHTPARGFRDINETRRFNYEDPEGEHHDG